SRRPLLCSPTRRSSDLPFIASENGAATMRLKGRRGDFESVVSVFELVYGGKIARMAIFAEPGARRADDAFYEERQALEQRVDYRSEEHTSELQSREKLV